MEDLSRFYSEHTFQMHFESKRLKTFEKWPFDQTCSCNPERMAKAGFFHIPTEQEPDGVCCFLCFKELDGWEPDDDPWTEHNKHSPKCPFLKLNGKPVESLTVEEFIRLEIERQKNAVNKLFDMKKKELEALNTEVRREMEHLVD
ncbi:hypothetical protein ACJMK2_035430 [Sinanodonta woodiana]|uniref:Uncharacterized protein n=2 Tax=Sinanodonta woodiana TaxID=1069815 RepID=A0ABD3WYF0_SINWO